MGDVNLGDNNLDRRECGGRRRGRTSVRGWIMEAETERERRKKMLGLRWNSKRGRER